MGVPEKKELLCPICEVPMVPAAGLPGVWQCPRRESHEFTADLDEDEDEDEAGLGARRRPGKQAQRDPPPAVRCPRCRARAKQDDMGLYCDSPVHDGPYRLPKEDEPHWLSHLGIRAPLNDIKQGSNMKDGSACLPLGPLQMGGGGKSGRKRKKPSKRSRGPAGSFFDT